VFATPCRMWRHSMRDLKSVLPQGGCGFKSLVAPYLRGDLRHLGRRWSFLRSS
jgi:hypothetical protein